MGADMEGLGVSRRCGWTSRIVVEIIMFGVHSGGVGQQENGFPPERDLMRTKQT